MCSQHRGPGTGSLRVPVPVASNNKDAARVGAPEPGPRAECAPLASWSGSQLDWMGFVDSDPFPPIVAPSVEIFSRVFMPLTSSCCWPGGKGNSFLMACLFIKDPHNPLLELTSCASQDSDLGELGWHVTSLVCRRWVA